jgi:hypothetical protein
MSQGIQRTVCPQCHAVLELQRPADTGTFLCGACDCEQSIASDESARFDSSLNIAAPHLTAMSKINVSASLDTVFLQSIALFREHFALLLATSLAVNVIWFALIGFPADALARLWQEVLGSSAGDARLLAMTFGGTGLVGVLIAPVSAYGMIVIIRLSLQIARYGSTGPGLGFLRRVLASLSIPVRPVMRLSGLLLLLGMMLACLLGVCLVAIVVLSFLLDPNTATWVGTLAVGAIVIVTVFLLQWLLWPAVFLIADGRTDLLAGVSWSVRLAWRNRKLTLSLVTVYFILATVGSMFFYVGQVVTTPLAMLPLAIGYLRVTGGQMKLARLEHRDELLIDCEGNYLSESVNE